MAFMGARPLYICPGMTQSIVWVQEFHLRVEKGHVVTAVHPCFFGEGFAARWGLLVWTYVPQSCWKWGCYCCLRLNETFDRASVPSNILATKAVRSSTETLGLVHSISERKRVFLLGMGGIIKDNIVKGRLCVRQCSLCQRGCWDRLSNWGRNILMSFFSTSLPICP